MVLAKQLVTFHGILLSSARAMRAALRMLHDSINKREEFESTGAQQIKEAIEHGNVDEVKRLINDAREQLNHAIMDLEEAEENTEIVQMRQTEILNNVVSEMNEMVEMFKKVEQTFRRVPDGERVHEKLQQGFATLYRELQEVVQTEQQADAEEYLLLLRQSEKKFDLVQNALNTVNTVMELANTFKAIRRAVRREKSTGKDVKSEEHRVVVLLHKLFEAKEPAEMETLVNRIIKEESRIERDMKRFHDLTIATIKNYTVVIKYTVRLFFQLADDTQIINRFVQELIEQQFPERDLKELQQQIQKKEASEHDLAVRLVNAFRRYARTDAQAAQPRAA